MESPKTMSKTRKEPVRAARRTGAPARAGRPRREVKRAALGRDEWVRAARDLLVRGDIGAVKVGALATQLGVTRESFYWHFASLADLHEELLRDWESDNTQRFELQHKKPADARHDLASIRFFLLGEETYRATWDTAPSHGQHRLLLENDPALLNQYSLIIVNPARHPATRWREAQRLVDWLRGPAGHLRRSADQGACGRRT